MAGGKTSPPAAPVNFFVSPEVRAASHPIDLRKRPGCGCMRPVMLPLLMLSSLRFAVAQVDGARELYAKTEYRQSLDSLQGIAEKDAGALQLIGQNQYMLGDY